MIKNENFIAIQGFMVKELKLKGNELLVYAIIYGFSQCGCGMFNGSRQYLADWTNSTKQGISKNLNSLVEKRLIDKKVDVKNGVRLVYYWATEFTGGGKQSLLGSKQSLPNNIDNNINNNIDIKKENKKERSYDDVFEEKNVEGELKDAFIELIKSRKLNKKNMTCKALELAIDKVRKLENSEDRQIKVIYQSIENGWQGLFALKDDAKTSDNSELYEIKSGEDISWKRVFAIWEEILGYKLVESVDNVEAAKELLALEDEHKIKLLIASLKMRGQYKFLIKEIKNVQDLKSLLDNRPYIWEFYNEHCDEWKRWTEKASEGKKRWVL